MKRRLVIWFILTLMLMVVGCNKTEETVDEIVGLEVYDEVLQEYSSDETLGYNYRDLNNDGMQELLIVSTEEQVYGETVVAIYVYQNGEVVNLMNYEYANISKILEGNIIYNYTWYNELSQEVGTYKLNNKEKLEYLEGYAIAPIDGDILDIGVYHKDKLTDIEIKEYFEYRDSLLEKVIILKVVPFK